MIEFRTSSSCSGGDCVEVGMPTDGTVVVRGTTDRSRELVFTTAEWAAFIAAVKAGIYDRPQIPPAATRVSSPARHRENPAAWPLGPSNDTAVIPGGPA